MDFSTHKVLEQATNRTLHAHSFSRASSQASLVLTDLLSRYLNLLSLTCAKYAQHAGRTGLTAADAFCALDELGVSMEELGEYCTSEGNEFGRYAVHTARRIEDLNELKAHLADGLKQDKTIIPLHYAPLSSSTLLDESEEEESEEEAEKDVVFVDEVEGFMDTVNVDVSRGWTSLPAYRSSTLPLPLSPISNPSSPSRKRPRTANWRPPPHIPDFLPPFPNDHDTPPHSLAPQSPRAPPIQPPPRRIEKPPSPLPQALAPTSSSDYLTQVPYSQSTLAALPEWHLPSPVPLPQPPLPTRPSRLPTPQTQPALFAAYHHILTHPPPPNTNAAHPARHKVAMALLSQTQTAPRWEPSDTLYSSVAPCQPRVGAIGYSWPVPISRTPSSDMKLARPEDKETKLPTAPPRSVSSIERLTPLVSQQPSRIPELARNVLPRSVHVRATRLAHPPALCRNGHKLIYGPGVDAPWNANPPPAGVVTPNGKAKDAPNGLSNGKGKETTTKVLQDARLYATWDYEQKDFREPLATGRRGRTGSVQGGPSGMTISLGTGARGRSGSKMG